MTKFGPLLIISQRYVVTAADVSRGYLSCFYNVKGFQTDNDVAFPLPREEWEVYGLAGLHSDSLDVLIPFVPVTLAFPAPYGDADFQPVAKYQNYREFGLVSWIGKHRVLAGVKIYLRNLTAGDIIKLWVMYRKVIIP